MITNNWRTSEASGPQGNCVEAGSAWRKSTHSAGGDCVEAGRAWRTSSICHHNGTCVEAGQVNQLVALRDTKDRARGMVTMSRTSFAQLLSGLR